MLITLAYRYEDHEPDETIEVDTAVGRRLIRDGKARPASTEQTSAPPSTPVRRRHNKEAADER